jgi:hypothetical protein
MGDTPGGAPPPALPALASHRIASHRIASHRIASHRIASHLASHAPKRAPLYEVCEENQLKIANEEIIRFVAICCPLDSIADPADVPLDATTRQTFHAKTRFARARERERERVRESEERQPIKRSCREQSERIVSILFPRALNK